MPKRKLTARELDHHTDSPQGAFVKPENEEQKHLLPSPHHRSGEHSAFKQTTLRLRIILAPCYINCVQEGIFNYINQFILRRLPDTEGILIAHDNIELEQPNARIMYDSPFLYFWIKVAVILWLPRVGDKLAGRVNLQSSSHIGLLLHQTFNASIPADHIPKNLYEWREDCWVKKKNGQVLGKDGKEVVFFVQEVIPTEDMLMVMGSLLPPHPEVAALEGVRQVKAEGTPPAKKRKKRQTK